MIAVMVGWTVRGATRFPESVGERTIRADYCNSLPSFHHSGLKRCSTRPVHHLRSTPAATSRESPRSLSRKIAMLMRLDGYRRPTRRCCGR
jgi:hypothetical protein